MVFQLKVSVSFKRSYCSCPLLLLQCRNVKYRDSNKDLHTTMYNLSKVIVKVLLTAHRCWCQDSKNLPKTEFLVVRLLLSGVYLNIYKYLNWKVCKVLMIYMRASPGMRKKPVRCCRAPLNFSNFKDFFCFAKKSYHASQRLSATWYLLCK